MGNVQLGARVWVPLAEHGESPVWVPQTGQLKFVDMSAGNILTIDSAGTLVERRNVGPVAAAFRARVDGGLVVAVKRGFAMLSADDELTVLPELWSDRRCA